MLASLPLFVTACKSVQENIEADIWLAEKAPDEVCGEGSPLWKVGVYRVVYCYRNPKSEFCQHGETEYEEFISYCSPAIEKYVAMNKQDKKKWVALLTKRCTK